MAFSGCMTCIDMQVFPATAKQHVGFGSDPTAGPGPFPTQPVAVASWPEVAPAAECVDQRRSRRKISNRESARRSRARKQRRLDELRDSAALLERGNRDLAARAEAARGGLALALLANAALRAEAAALSRRLAAARRALVQGRLYAGADAAASVDGDCCLGSTDTADDCLVDRLAVRAADCTFFDRKKIICVMSHRLHSWAILHRPEFQDTWHRDNWSK